MKQDQANKLHAQIMNLPCKPPDYRSSRDADVARASYIYGHRDARHAAAELVSASLAAPPRLSDALRQALDAMECVARWVEQRPTPHPYDAWRSLGVAIVNVRALLAAENQQAGGDGVLGTHETKGDQRG